MRYLLILLLLACQGCTAYGIASSTSLAISGKSIPDHITTAVVPNSDCSSLNVLKGYYYCEINDPSKQYNRSGY